MFKYIDILDTLMGTRSLTIFRDDGKDIAVLYRQFDGYPTGHGLDIANFMKDKSIVEGYNLTNEEKGDFNGISELGVRLIAWLKITERKNNEDNDKIYKSVKPRKYPANDTCIGQYYLIEPKPDRLYDCWQEYIYVITKKEGKPFIELFGDSLIGKPDFAGTPQEFITKYGKAK